MRIYFTAKLQKSLVKKLATILGTSFSAISQGVAVGKSREALMIPGRCRRGAGASGTMAFAQVDLITAISSPSQHESAECGEPCAFEIAYFTFVGGPSLVAAWGDWTKSSSVGRLAMDPTEYEHRSQAVHKPFSTGKSAESRPQDGNAPNHTRD